MTALSDSGFYYVTGTYMYVVRVVMRPGDGPASESYRRKSVKTAGLRET